MSWVRRRKWSLRSSSGTRYSVVANRNSSRAVLIGSLSAGSRMRQELQNSGLYCFSWFGPALAMQSAMCSLEMRSYGSKTLLRELAGHTFGGASGIIDQGNLSWRSWGYCGSLRTHLIGVGALCGRLSLRQDFAPKRLQMLALKESSRGQTHLRRSRSGVPLKRWCHETGFSM